MIQDNDERERRKHSSGDISSAGLYYCNRNFALVVVFGMVGLIIIIDVENVFYYFSYKNAFFNVFFFFGRFFYFLVRKFSILLDLLKSY